MLSIKNIILISIIMINIFSFGHVNTFISLPLSILIFCYLVQKNFNIIKYINKKTVILKLLLSFVIFAYISFLYNFLFHGASFLRFLYSINITYISAFILCFVLGILLPFYYKNTKCIRIVCLSLLIIIFFGLLEFLMLKFHSNFIEKILYLTTSNNLVGNFKSGSMRIQSFFLEPSHFAWFLACNIPLAWELCLSKYAVFKNKYLNIAIKKSLVILLYLALILTLSPINLIFSILITTTYFIIRHPLSLKKLFTYLIPILFFVCIVILNIHNGNIDLSNTYLYRIQRVIENCTSMEAFIEAEPSLATRLISYYNMFLIFTKNLIFGTGCGQLAIVFKQQLYNSPLPLTYELAKSLLTTKIGGANPAIFFKIAVDMGLAGLSCFYLFLYNMLRKIKLSIKYCINIEQNFLRGIALSIVVFIFLTFYDSQINCHYFWILFGIGFGISMKKILKQKGMRKWMCQ